MLSFLEATTTKHCLQNFVYISVMFEKMTIGKLVSYILTYLSTSPLKKKLLKDTNFCTLYNGSRQKMNWT